MIEPVVGRVVWFIDPNPTVQNAQPYAAQIAFVHSPKMINIGYLDHNGEARSRTSVELLQDDDPIPAHAHCVWMPYQKGQAAKTEALQAQLGK